MTLFQIGYYLNEEKDWALDIHELKRALDEGRKHSNPRVLCVINPGNLIVQSNINKQQEN